MAAQQERETDTMAASKVQAGAPAFQPRPPDMGPPKQSLRFLGNNTNGDSTVPTTASTTSNKKKSDQKTAVFFSGIFLEPKEIQDQHDQLLEEMWEQEEVLLKLQQNSSQLESTLVYKRAQLDRLKMTGVNETSSLKAKLEQFTKQLQFNRKDQPQAEKEHQTKVKEYQKKQATLEQQVTVLQTDLVRITNEMRTEQERFATLTQRMDEVSGTQEWEAAEFEQLQEDLLAESAEQQLAITNLQANVANGTTVMDQQRMELRSQLSNRKTESTTIDTQLRDYRQDHLSQSIFLENAIRNQRADTAEEREQLDASKSNHSSILDGVRAQLEGRRNENEQLQLQLQQETVEFLELESQLKDTLVDANQTKDLLLLKIKTLQSKWDGEQAYLTGRLELDSKRLAILQKQLGYESAGHGKDRAEWKGKRDDRLGRTRGARIEMQRRFSLLRSLLHGRWQSAKQEGRAHEKMLIGFYEQDVADTKNAILYLTESVALSRQNLKDLQQLVYGTSQTAESLESAKKNLEHGLTDRLTRANQDMHYLKGDKIELQQVLHQREDDIDELETSGRAIARASWKLTKRRARKLRNLVLRR